MISHHKHTMQAIYRTANCMEREKRFGQLVLSTKVTSSQIGAMERDACCREMALSMMETGSMAELVATAY